MPEHFWQKDPEAKREAEAYDNPVPSREYILMLLEERGRPLTHAQVCAGFQITDETSVEAIRRRLKAMERDGQLMRNRKGAFCIVEKLELIQGTMIGHRDGFGFLKPDDGGEDLYLSPRQMRCGFDGDRALVRQSGVDHRGRREGSIVEILERNTKQVVGRYFRESGIGFVVPENRRISQDILVGPDLSSGAEPGQYVVLDIVQQPSYHRQSHGKVVEVLGDHMAPGMEIDVAIHSHGIPSQWPEEVLAAADRFGTDVPEALCEHRIDLRQTPLVTIDGEDARDFDDAVFCERKRSGGWKLIVAIADVSHYVHPGDVLDKEAFVRGNSVYFPSFVVPMLPEALSNGLCSLNPGVDRLAMVCELAISASGKVSRYRFYEAVINSHARLTYTKVGALLGEPDSQLAKQVRADYGPVVPVLEELHNLYKALRKQRDSRGAIDFETTETRIVFGGDRKIDRIVPVYRNDAHKLIEECMLCANVAAAKVLEKHELPVLYRVHEGPQEKKLENLRLFLQEVGLQLEAKGSPTKPSDYQTVLQQAEGRPDAHLIQTILLRSMSQAVYSPENQGHFGLAYKAYAHFTSPIRRYPDLLVHRAIRYLIRSRVSSRNVLRVPGAERLPKAQWLPYGPGDMAELGANCSMTERRADDATRDVEGWLKCEYMSSKVGEVFNGVVSAVTGFGLFVELEGIFVEGLVHISSLASDYYHFDPVRHRLTGEKSGIVFGLGDGLTVRVMRVDLDERKLDLEVVEGGRKNRWSSNGKGKKKTSGAGKGQKRKKAGAARGKGSKGKRAKKASETTRASNSKNTQARGRPSGSGETVGKKVRKSRKKTSKKN